VVGSNQEGKLQEVWRDREIRFEEFQKGVLHRDNPKSISQDSSSSSLLYMQSSWETGTFSVEQRFLELPCFGFVLIVLVWV
jgi:hypothetical protein